MRCFFGLLALGMLVLAGCAVRMRELGPGAESWQFERVNQELGLYRGRAVLQSGDTLRGSRFYIYTDSTVWLEGRARERRAFPNNAIQNVSVVGRWGSPWSGMGYGAMVGGSGGAVVGTLAGLCYTALVLLSPEPKTSSEPPDSLGNPRHTRHDSEEAEALWAPLYGGVLGAATGATLGAAVGFVVPQLGQPMMVTFRFPLDPPRVSRASTPR